MQPIDQTVFGVPNGNCFSACVASILHIPLGEVPPFCTYGDWWERFNEWLKPQGYYATIIRYSEDHAPLGFHILSGKSPRGDFQHSVVAMGNDIVHDPHPSRSGIETRVDQILIVPLDCSEFVRKDHTISRLYIFDADGTLRRCTVPNQPCPNRPDEWEIIPWAAERIRQIDWSTNGFGIVSNQAGISLGYLDKSTAMQMLGKLASDLIGKHPRLGAIRICPHDPKGNCHCRKPQPKLIRDVADVYDVPNSRVVYIGDLESDKQAADAAHVSFRWVWDFCGKTQEEWTDYLQKAHDRSLMAR
jgi:D-glycero-D-manno-heptose 1,7-bisphosphate phosphatase